MSDEKQLDRCILCEKQMVESQNLRVVKAKAIETLCKASKQRKDRKSRAMRLKDELQLHLNCYNSYVRERNIISSLKKKAASKADKRRESTNSQEQFVFHECCFFCGDNASDEEIRKGHKKCSKLVSEDALNRIIEKLESAESREGQFEIILSRLKGASNVLELSPRYHTICYSRFWNYNDFATSRGRPKCDEISKAVQFVIEHLKENREECQFSLRAILNLHDANSTLSLRYIKDRVEEEMSNDVSVYSVKDDYVICLRGIGTNVLGKDWYASRLKDEKLERSRIVEAAANIVLQDIRGQYCDCEHCPSPDDVLNDADSQVPDTLRSFVGTLIKKNKDLEKERDKWESRVTAACHSLVSSARPRSFLSPVLLGLSCVMHSNGASGLLIDGLSRVGLCAPYDQTLSFESSNLPDPESKLRFADSYARRIFGKADRDAITPGAVEEEDENEGASSCKRPRIDQ